MARNGMMKNGEKIVRKLRKLRKQKPVEWKLKLAFELQQAEELGGHRLSGEMLLPIRKGAIASMSKFKKDDIIRYLRQAADMIENDDYSSIGVPIDVTEMASKTRRKMN
jgi:hypothetical protein